MYLPRTKFVLMIRQQEELCKSLASGHGISPFSPTEVRELSPRRSTRIGWCIIAKRLVVALVAHGGESKEEIDDNLGERNGQISAGTAERGIKSFE
jgi:hypothetical protein